jgi:integrase
MRHTGVGRIEHNPRYSKYKTDVLGGSDMQTVQPIREIEDIYRMLEGLGKWNVMYRMLFLIGINTGLRISDLRQLRVRDVRKNYITMTEQKSGRQMRVLINEELRHEIDDYIQSLPNDRVLFPSREGKNSPISTSRAWQVLNAVASEIGLEQIGTHTMRKTFAHHTYKKTKDLALVMRHLNHVDVGTTMRYLGLQQADMDAAMESRPFVEAAKPHSDSPQKGAAELPPSLNQLIDAIDRLTAAVEKHGAQGLVTR